jgi:hypothetical protein
VVGQGHHDPLRAEQAGGRADEHVAGPGAHEPVDQLLGHAPVDLGDPGRDPLEAVTARVEHVGVQAVLVGTVAVAAELRPEPAAAGAALVADDQARGVRVGGPMLSATRSSTWTSRSVPLRRQARLGLVPVTGSTVTKWVPAGGSSTPPTSRPRLGRPSARDRRHTIAASGGRPRSITPAVPGLWTATGAPHPGRLRSPTGGLGREPAQ